MLTPSDVHRSWDDFLTEDIRGQLVSIEKFLANEEYNPRPENVLRFLKLDLNSIKVVWRGMDPYPAKDVATGRAFEVGGMTSWLLPFRQVSLKNILRLVHKNYTNVDDYNDIKSFKEIQPEIESGLMSLSPPDKWFANLEQQGVLFLNSYLTVKVGESNSHKELWSDFSVKLLQFISLKRPDLIWFLWGKEACLAKEYISNGTLYESRHPMMCSVKYQDDFLKSSCFKDTMHIINWLC